MTATLTINGHSTPCAPGESLFDCAQRIHVPVPTSCQKQGKCKECLVEVVEGMALLSKGAEEEKHLSGSFRLSCRALVVADSGEIRCHTMRRGHMRVETGGVTIRAAAPIERQPAALTRGYGIAMDLGTTTVVMRLFDLDSGQLVADASFENPQRFGGSDVMSRIHYDTHHPGKLLRRTLAGYLRHAIAEFPVDPLAIREMVVVGNSTMRDIFFRQSVETIGQSPYRSLSEIEMEAGKRITTTLSETGRRCLLPIHPEARVYGGPIISGHVGADAAACMLAVDIGAEDRLVAVMDIGTNTELIVGNRHRILAASCPAGPAFEGGAIRCGMPALDGAIEDVAIGDDGRVTYRVIGHEAPAGICGSGLVSLAGELLRTGRMNAMGRLEDTDRFVVDQAHDVYLTEADINELAQAKGANVAGLKVVLSNYGVDFDDIDVFYLAGGFGRHLPVDASRRIGLIPDLPDSKIVPVGNAAIEGASIALLSPERRAELEQLVGRVEHCRLETHPDFFDYFVDGCQFRPI